MAVDWGLYSALRGTDNWAQRRQDKAMNLQLIQAMHQEEQQKVQQSMLAEQEINKYFDEITGLQSEYLEEDQARIQEVEKKARQRIIQGIGQYNGDLSRYISSGGISDLGEYKNSILKSDELKKAKMNKVNFGAILKDYQEGDRYIHKVLVDIPATDEEGNPKVGPNGEPVLQPTKVSVEQAIKLFKDGVIDSLPYQGSEKKVKINPMLFKQYFKDPLNPASRDNIVTTSDVKFMAMQMGASEEYADALADDYYETIKSGGDPWKWRALSDYELEMMELKKNALKQSTTKKSSSGSSGTITLNQLAPALQRLGKSGEAKTMYMGNVDREYFQENLGLRYDNNSNTYKPTMPLVGKDALVKDKEFDLTNALSVNFTGKYVGENDEQFIEAVVYYDADNPGKNNPHDEKFPFQDNTLTDAVLRHNWEQGKPSDFGLPKDIVDDNVWKGTVLIPITKQVNDRRFMNDIEKKRGITNKFEAAAASADDMDYYNQSLLQYANAYEISPEEAYRIVQETIMQINQ